MPQVCPFFQISPCPTTTPTQIKDAYLIRALGLVFIPNPRPIQVSPPHPMAQTRLYPADLTQPHTSTCLRSPRPADSLPPYPASRANQSALAADASANPRSAPCPSVRPRRAPPPSPSPSAPTPPWNARGRGAGGGGTGARLRGVRREPVQRARRAESCGARPAGREVAERRAGRGREPGWVSFRARTRARGPAPALNHVSSGRVAGLAACGPCPPVIQKDGLCASLGS